jgi:hypothetical protein
MALNDMIWSVIAVIGAFVVVGGVMYFMLNPGTERDEEEAARAFFDAHGHWPDEDLPGEGPPAVNGAAPASRD